MGPLKAIGWLQSSNRQQKLTLCLLQKGERIGTIFGSKGGGDKGMEFECTRTYQD